ncbi:tetraacyldisaccharide 4'-kinase [Ancylobacter mangrovi]|uniref:Tetraacyldisaccharide 4'-kinase n=1 Tax=Ancylobacter mangrovi TaxID=2972472 RepID=A0A9X2PBI3_9HYPH|nr:tetraacyldisaccharide 4'-kinase [Ancylobacter mangrovi]MCS0494905.1 tetraacyldisaccharide 4'-kinase [Ancylobacter mangrovi]MCS0502299.1 tetraacyldisaccharide 4'-kinase [Ancylobacter mangrovi]
MQAPDFWWRRERSTMAKLLSPLGTVLGALTLARMRGTGASVGLPVVCIGNPTVGGAGKTPTAIHLARRLARQGRRPAILTRGYGGREHGPVQVDPAHHHAEDVGDEPLLLARAAPTYVARDRIAGALTAVQDSADILLMDDGFQNPALAKSLSILVVDAGVGVGNGLCVPAGPLRAPLGPQLARAQALLVLGEGAPGERVAREGYAAGLVVLRGRLAPEAQAVARLFGRRVLAYAGIGRPGKFFETLKSLGVLPVVTREFPDHHVFTAAEAAELRQQAEEEDLLLVTTEKDAVRLAGSEAGEGLLEASEVLPVRLALEPHSAKALDRMLAGAIA